MKFPIKKYYTVNEYGKNYFKLLNELSESINFKKLDKIIKIIKKNYSSKFNKLFVCGNGGSAALANHFACDHQKILFETKKIKPEIISLSSNTALITAIANDNSYDQIFVDQLKQTGNKKDILFIVFITAVIILAVIYFSVPERSLFIENQLKWWRELRIAAESFFN